VTQPPGNTSTTWGVLAGPWIWKRLTPGAMVCPSTVVGTAHVAVSRIVTLPAAACARGHSPAMRETDGTDWAWRHNFSSWVRDPEPLQPPMAAAPPGFALERANTQAIGTAAGISTNMTRSRSPTRRALQR